MGRDLVNCKDLYKCEVCSVLASSEAVLCEFEKTSYLYLQSEHSLASSCLQGPTSF